MEDNRHVYLVGAKSIGMYGGYESFVANLLNCHKDDENITYHVACKENGDGAMALSSLSVNKETGRYEYLGSECFLINVPEFLRAAGAIYYDLAALKLFIKHIRENGIKNPAVFIMACRIGPFMKKYVKKIHSLGGKVYINPDGHEWKRAKWSFPVRKYWKESERLMVKNADLIICDSVNIEKYILKEYGKYNPKTTFIAYGAALEKSICSEDKYKNWLKKHGIGGEYYTVVGRCVPENNFETIIREFMKSSSDKDLAIITTDNKKMLFYLEEKLGYSADERIKFTGTVYDKELLTKIREESYGNFHGHSVGGTNPSLLEALGSTKLNLLYKVGFNEEVAKDAALYWTLEDGNLSALIDLADKIPEGERNIIGQKAKNRIKSEYSWERITGLYKEAFLGKFD
ncbi:MAG: DUF1972 domain-containing protein [Eubacterium sp.]|nr:DUF1972 domain-containing protein [Eubacterium sp.]